MVFELMSCKQNQYQWSIVRTREINFDQVNDQIWLLFEQAIVNSHKAVEDRVFGGSEYEVTNHQTSQSLQFPPYRL